MAGSKACIAFLLLSLCPWLIALRPSLNISVGQTIISEVDNKRYRVVRELRVNINSAVYVVTEVGSSTRIVLKLFVGRGESAVRANNMASNFTRSRHVVPQSPVSFFETGTTDAVAFGETRFQGLTMPLYPQTLDAIVRDLSLVNPSSRFTNAERVQLLEDLAESSSAGLASIHRDGAHHYDMRPGNIFAELSRDERNAARLNAVVGDFDNARPANKPAHEGLSFGYYPPEAWAPLNQIAEDVLPRTPDIAHDVFGQGVALLVALVGSEEWVKDQAERYLNRDVAAHTQAIDEQLALAQRAAESEPNPELRERKLRLVDRARAATNASPSARMQRMIAVAPRDPLIRAAQSPGGSCYVAYANQNYVVDRLLQLRDRR